MDEEKIELLRKKLETPFELNEIYYYLLSSLSREGNLKIEKQNLISILRKALAIRDLNFVEYDSNNYEINLDGQEIIKGSRTFDNLSLGGAIVDGVGIPRQSERCAINRFMFRGDLRLKRINSDEVKKIDFVNSLFVIEKSNENILNKILLSSIVFGSKSDDQEVIAIDPVKELVDEKEISDKIEAAFVNKKTSEEISLLSEKFIKVAKFLTSLINKINQKSGENSWIEKVVQNKKVRENFYSLDKPISGIVFYEKADKFNLDGEDRYIPVSEGKIFSFIENRFKEESNDKDYVQFLVGLVSKFGQNIDYIQSFEELIQLSVKLNTASFFNN